MPRRPILRARVGQYPETHEQRLSDCRRRATGQVGTLMLRLLRERSFPVRVPRPPVVFCRDGETRVVVRRESFEDPTARDVR
jgi:hypothetical protein